MESNVFTHQPKLKEFKQYNNKVGEALKIMLKNNNKDVCWLADTTGVDRSKMSHVYSGRNSMTLDILIEFYKHENLHDLVKIFISFDSYKTFEDFYNDIVRYYIKNPSQL